MEEDNLLYSEQNKVEQDAWDDTALIKAYDIAVGNIKSQKFSSGAKAAVNGVNHFQHPNASVNKRPPKQKKGKKRQRNAFQLSHNAMMEGTLGDWQVGNQCQCPYSQDGYYYPAEIESIDFIEGTCVVRFLEYGNTEMHSLSELSAAQEMAAAEANSATGDMQTCSHDEEGTVSGDSALNAVDTFTKAATIARKRQHSGSGAHHPGPASGFSFKVPSTSAVNGRQPQQHRSPAAANRNRSPGGGSASGTWTKHRSQKHAASTDGSDAEDLQRKCTGPSSMPHHTCMGPHTSQYVYPHRRGDAPLFPPPHPAMSPFSGHHPHQHTHHPPPLPPMVPPPPPLTEGMSPWECDAMHSMLMSWYVSGYHTGYYHGLKAAASAKHHR